MGASHTEDRASGEKSFAGPIVAVAYYRPPSPPRGEWEADFRRMREMGFEAVKMWFYWGWHERAPGRFTWDDGDRFFELAEANGLKVVPNIILELPPSWLEIEHVLQTPAGPVAKAHFPSMHIPCFDDANLRRAAEPFIRALVERYRERAVLHWDVWNEPRSRWDCTCEASRESYRRWLEKKFATVDRYNEIFGKCFHDWDAVSAHVRGSDYADEYNWRLWAAERLAEQVHWVARIVRQHDPVHPVMAHVGSCSPIQSVRRDTSVDAMMMSGLDFYGCSYDASWESQLYTTDERNVKGLEGQSDLTRARIQLDWIRSLSPKNWICELYGDHFCAWVTRAPETLMWQFWQAVSRGLAGIMLWEYKVERIGIESLGYGLLGLDGQPNRRSRALAEAIRLLKGELADFFARFAFREPSVGILYDERSHLLSEFEAEWYRGGYASCGNIHQRASWALYETLRRRNLPVRWVPRQLVDDALPALDALFLPGHGVMDDQLADRLVRFAENGGHLIGQPGVGFRRDNTWVSAVVPSCGLDELFGVTETARALVDGKIELLDRRGRVIEHFASLRVDLECRGAKPEAWFADGAVAMASRPFGKGQTHYLGGFLGLDEPGAGRCLRALGIETKSDDVPAKPAELRLDVIPWRRRGGGVKERAYFVFNSTGGAVEFDRPETATATDTPLFGDVSTANGKVTLGPASGVLLR